ncbi:hypothetical protein B0H63DRAFT_524509 [Podospora didyma]|uniref:Uncharacterized protein n=1 Tax=Podospora didyma TaxID=330526 RepID=A0AAE0NHW7_9PEZI|nr:hypothetical protein B0H63DRAFT_524509 [Podospora didyma]
MASSTPSPAFHPIELTAPKKSPDRDFSHSQLKPAPLRLMRKRQSGADGGNEHSTEHSRHPPPKDGSSLEAHITTPRSSPARTPFHRVEPNDAHRGGGNRFLELSAAPRPPAPALAGLVSKYDMLDAMSNIDTRDFGISTPRKRPTKPTPKTSPELTPAAKQQTPKHTGYHAGQPKVNPRTLFAEGSPFKKLPRIAITTSEGGSSSTDRSSQISPTNLKSPSAFAARNMVGSSKTVDSPLKQHREVDPNTAKIGDHAKKGYTED